MVFKACLVIFFFRPFFSDIYFVVFLSVGCFWFWWRNFVLLELLLKNLGLQELVFNACLQNIFFFPSPSRIGFVLCSLGFTDCSRIYFFVCLFWSVLFSFFFFGLKFEPVGLCSSTPISAVLRQLFRHFFSTGGLILVLVKKLCAFGVVAVGEFGFAGTNFQCMFAEVFLFFFFPHGLVL